MANKLYAMEQLTEEVAKDVSANPQEWIRFLNTASRLYRYTFPEQLLIYAQRPGATAVASMEIWNQKMLAAVAGILFTAVSLWQTPGSYGKAENTVSAAMMRRFTWSHMRVEKEYDTWPEELRSLYSWEEIQQSGRYAGTIWRCRLRNRPRR